jgi:hypothetical protein
MSPIRPRKHDAKTGEAVGKHHDRLVERWRNTPPLPGGSGSQGYLPQAWHKLQYRLPQGPFGAATVSCLHEEGERPRFLRSLEKKAIDAGGAG